MKRTNPQTSHDAHYSIQGAKGYYYKKIISALESIKVGATFEETAKVAGIRPDQAWRRLSELVQCGVCFNTGYTRKTSSGRQAMVRQLTGMKPMQTETNPKTEVQLKSNVVIQQLSLL